MSNYISQAECDRRVAQARADATDQAAAIAHRIARDYSRRGNNEDREDLRNSAHGAAWVREVLRGRVTLEGEE